MIRVAEWSKARNKISYLQVTGSVFNQLQPKQIYGKDKTTCITSPEHHKKVI